MRRVTSLLLPGVLLLTVVGCSSSEQPASSATCEALQAAVEGAQREAEVAISEMTSDPQAATDRLAAVRESLEVAVDEVAADERDFVTRAETAARQLGRQADRSAAGKVIDGAAVGDVRTDLLTIVQDVRANC